MSSANGRGASLVFFAIGILLFGGGCVAPPRVEPAELVRRAYSAYARQLDVLADFETDDQLEMCSVAGGDGSSVRPALSPDVSRSETGRRGLSVRLRAEDRLVLDVRRRMLPREHWRDWSLLILSVHSPEDGTVLTLRIGQASTTRTSGVSGPASTQPVASRTAASAGAASTEAGEPEVEVPLTTRSAATDAMFATTGMSESAPSASAEVEPAAPPFAAPAWEGRFVLRAGWNLLRVDLDDVRDEIAMERVASISLAVREAREAVELHLDDVILADDTREIVAAPDGEGLQLLARGRRLRVSGFGALAIAAATEDEADSEGDRRRPALVERRRFELTFVDGTVVAVRGETDRNLCVPTGLGPWPLALRGEWWLADPPPTYDDAHMFEAWGPSVAASQALLEATPFRVVIRGRWRYRMHPALEISDAAPGHTWEYTVYADGRVYVRIASDGAAVGWPAELAGYAVALEGRRSFEWTGPADGAKYVLLPRAGANRTDLLWAPHQWRWLEPRRCVASADDERLAVVSGAVPAQAGVDSAHLLRVWPRDLDDGERAAWMAHDYCEPAALRLTAGMPVLDAPGDLNEDGFNESSGCFELRPARGIVRLVFQAGGRLRYRPVFRIHETAGKRVAAYMNGRVVQTIARDASDEALVMVPLITDRDFALEVVLRER